MKMDALIIGGTSGIGLALSVLLAQEEYERIYLVGRREPSREEIPERYRQAFECKKVFLRENLVNGSLDFLDAVPMENVETLICAAGFGRVASLASLTDAEVRNLLTVNEEIPVRVLRRFYEMLADPRDRFCAVLSSIAGHIVSPLFSAYGAAKAGLCSFVESANIELEASGSPNRILDVSPGAVPGTRFHGGAGCLEEVLPLAADILVRMRSRERLFIPDFESVYASVLHRYQNDPVQFGLESYQYKISSGRVTQAPQVVIGYLSGTFDLFHVGHLNLLRRAKEQCDYLIVGVHESGAWKGKETFIPFEERKAILESVRYVDRVIKSFPEDCDAWSVLHYNKLFVGSDYQGSERFARYEAYFADKDVEIVYFPYTKGTSSTQLRKKLTETK